MMKEFFLDAQGRMWYGSGPNNKVGYFVPTDLIKAEFVGRGRVPHRIIRLLPRTVASLIAYREVSGCWPGIIDLRNGDETK